MADHIKRGSKDKREILLLNKMVFKSNKTANKSPHLVANASGEFKRYTKNGVKVPEELTLKVTHGNLKNDTLSFSGHKSFFPADALGGSNENEAAKPVTVLFDGISEEVRTDVDSIKNILRKARGQLKRFYKLYRYKTGDSVYIIRESERTYRISNSKFNLKKTESEELSENINTEKPSFRAIQEKLDLEVSEASKVSSHKRKEVLLKSNKKPEKVTVTITVYIRNPYVVAEVLARASGTCERCSENAPFKRRKDGSPYLEVHHLIPLSENGEDTVQNAIGLCPNCHRELHFGNNV